MAVSLLPYGVDHVAWDGPGAIVSAQQAIAGPPITRPALQPAWVQLWATAMPDQAGARRGNKAQISGFGEAANRPVATAQPSRWRADGGATALDRNIELLPPDCRISQGAPIACCAHRVE